MIEFGNWEFLGEGNSVSAIPKNVVLKSGRYYFRRRKNGKDTYTRLPHIDDASFADALAIASRVAPPSPLAASAVRKWTQLERRYAPRESHPKSLINTAREARKRAARRGLTFDLSLDQLMVIWQRCNGRCEVSGLPFDAERGEHHWRPYAPSIDRRDCSEGYTFSNVRLVCVCVNAALNQWGDDVFWNMVGSANKTRWGTVNG